MEIHRISAFYYFVATGISRISFISLLNVDNGKAYI